MRIAITGRHVDITPALRRYIETRVKRLERYGVQVGSTQVVLGVEKYRHTAELIVTINGAVLQSKASTTEMYASIDQLLDKVGRQIQKRKEKRVDRKVRTAGVKIAGNGGTPTVVGPTIRTVRAVPPVLTREEATDRLGASADSLLVYRDALSSRLQVMRRLDEGAVELIDPQPA